MRLGTSVISVYNFLRFVSIERNNVCSYGYKNFMDISRCLKTQKSLDCPFYGYRYKGLYGYKGLYVYKGLYGYEG